MSQLNSTDSLDYGQDYTFTFKLSSILGVQQVDIQAALSQLQDLGQVNAIESLIGPATVMGGQWDVQFTFAGDDTTATVASVAQEISSAVASIHMAGTSFTFLLAQTDFVQTSAANLNQALNTLLKGSGGTNIPPPADTPNYTTWLIGGAAALVGLVLILKFA